MFGAATRAYQGDGRGGGRGHQYHTIELKTSADEHKFTTDDKRKIITNSLLFAGDAMKTVVSNYLQHEGLNWNLTSKLKYFLDDTPHVVDADDALNTVCDNMIIADKRNFGDVVSGKRFKLINWGDVLEFEKTVPRAWYILHCNDQHGNVGFALDLKIAVDQTAAGVWSRRLMLDVLDNDLEDVCQLHLLTLFNESYGFNDMKTSTIFRRAFTQRVWDCCNTGLVTSFFASKAIERNEPTKILSTTMIQFKDNDNATQLIRTDFFVTFRHRETLTEDGSIVIEKKRDLFQSSFARFATIRELVECFDEKHVNPESFFAVPRSVWEKPDWMFKDNKLSDEILVRQGKTSGSRHKYAY